MRRNWVKYGLLTLVAVGVAGFAVHAVQATTGGWDGIFSLTSALPAVTPKTDGKADEKEAKGQWIGIQCHKVDAVLRSQLDLSGGVVVDHVMSDSPAAKAGIQQNDILLSAGDQTFAEVADLIQSVRQAKGELTLKVLRKGKSLSVKVTPAPMSAPKGEMSEKHVFDWPFPNMNAREWKIERLGPGILFGIHKTEKAGDSKTSVSKNLAVTITKSGNTPAKIVVRQNDKKWETTEDKLDKLPKDVRSYVKKMLGREWPAFRFHFEPIAPPIQWPMRHFSGWPDIPNWPTPFDMDVDGVFPRRRIHTRRLMEEMQQQMDQMQRQIESLQNQQGNTENSERGSVPTL